MLDRLLGRAKVAHAIPPLHDVIGNHASEIERLEATLRRLFIENDRLLEEVIRLRIEGARRHHTTEASAQRPIEAA